MPQLRFWCVFRCREDREADRKVLGASGIVEGVKYLQELPKLQIPMNDNPRRLTLSTLYMCPSMTK